MLPFFYTFHFYYGNIKRPTPRQNTPDDCNTSGGDVWLGGIEQTHPHQLF